MASTPLHSADLKELLAIGVALAAERDLEKLLVRILEKSRYFLLADAGSLFLAEEQGFETPLTLQFKIAQNDSVPVALKEFSLPINSKSLAGYVAETGEPIRIDDVYSMKKNLPFHFNTDIDRSTGYRSKSLLSVAMKDHQDQLIGVVQLWNKKKKRKTILTPATTARNVVSFSKPDLELLSSLASQAGIAIENARLYSSIQNLFQGFIRASVKAIEARDPTTSGHSERVAMMTVSLAKAVDETTSGPYKIARFSSQELHELEVAALLHDFGKIGVRESVLTKAKKLYPLELENLFNRIGLFLKGLELDAEKRKVQHLLQGGNNSDDHWRDILGQLEIEQKNGRGALEWIQASNEPTVLEKPLADSLADSIRPLLSRGEYEQLSVPRGSLTFKERQEIESHVSYTYEFLSQIPWTRELKNVPSIAYAHHEKLDGSGYPLKKSNIDIPVPAKIMAVADIYDALTAADRPYKKAISTDDAIDILRMEAQANKLDTDLVEMFAKQRIFSTVGPRTW